MPKAAENATLAERVGEYVARSPAVRPFPATVSRLLSTCQDPSASASAFEPIIECDPALSIHILRVANSPIYSPATKVTSIARAVSMLGTNKLKSIAMSVAGASMFSSGTTAADERRLLWKHSIGCATVARQLAEYIPGIDAQDAFLAGIFHDVGKLLFFDVVPEEYAALEHAWSRRSLSEEEAMFGTTHEVIGLKSAHTWGLPKEIKSAIGWHHRPDLAPVHANIAAAIGCADALARHWGIGTDEMVEQDNHLLSKSQLSDERLSQVRERAISDFAETMELWTA